jgi:DNA-binding MarR family transcriptional regulator
MMSSEGIQLNFSTLVEHFGGVVSTQQPDDPDQDLGVLLGLAYQTLVRELNEHMAAAGFDIKTQYGYVFRALLKEDLTSTKFGARLGMTTQGAAKLIDEMERLGYVEKHPDPTDARVRVLRLADRGRRAVAEARKFHQAFEDRLAERYGTEDAAALRRVLVALVDDAYGDAPRVMRLP